MAQFLLLFIEESERIFRNIIGRRGVMNNKVIPVIIFLIVILFSIFPAGESESGRDSAISMMDSYSYVASSYLDLDSILDDYYYLYEINKEESLTYNITVSNRSVLSLGGQVDLQVSIKTNDYDFFPETDFNYIIYINDSVLLENNEYYQAFAEGMEGIFQLKSPGSRIFFYFKKDEIIKELVAQTALGTMLEELKGQYIFKLAEKSEDYEKKAKEDLFLLLKAAPQNGNPNKFFWVFNKTIAKSVGDINDIFSLIAGLGEVTTEISFCGFSDNFRAATVSSIIDQFGGNSYYFFNAEDLADIIIKDYRFYLHPSVSDLRILIYDLRNTQNSNPVKTISIKSMGAEEHHTYLTPFTVPPKHVYYNDTSSFNVSDTYPMAMVLVEYLDNKTDKYIYSSVIQELNYTDSYKVQMESLDRDVNRNIQILDTYTLLNNISQLLQDGNYKDPLLKLNTQIEKLLFLNREFDNALISEDIELLKKYKELIYENKKKPFRGLKAFSELSLKQY
jgi:hypothetical protein